MKASVYWNIVIRISFFGMKMNSFIFGYVDSHIPLLSYYNWVIDLNTTMSKILEVFDYFIKLKCFHYVVKALTNNSRIFHFAFQSGLFYIQTYYCEAFNRANFLLKYIQTKSFLSFVKCLQLKLFWIHSRIYLFIFESTVFLPLFNRKYRGVFT